MSIAADRSAASPDGHATRSRSLPLVFILALRELRSGLSGFGIFITCIALGVAVITGVGALADGLMAGFAREGRVLLGGDLTLERVHARITPEERARLERFGSVGETASLRTMARTVDGEDQTLAELKAVDTTYPQIGQFTLEGGESLQAAIHRERGVLIAPSLLDRLDIKVGDMLNVAGTNLPVTGVISNEPDKIGATLAFGPRVMISTDTLEAIGLAAPGSLVEWKYSVILPGDSLPTDEEVVAAREAIERTMGDAGFTVRDRRDPSPQLTVTLERLRQFLTLLGLTALLVGGVGVANAVATFVDRRRGVIAAYKSLGASRAQVFSVFLVQVMTIALVGVAIGLAFGLTMPVIVAWAFQSSLPFTILPQIGWRTVATGIAYGLLVALVFVLWPLGQAERIRPAALFRNEVAGSFEWPSRRSLVLVAVAGIALVAFTVFASGLPYIALGFIGGAAVTLSLFWLLGLAVERLSRRVPRPRRPALAIAITDLAAPGGLTRSVILSLGTGLSLLVMVALVDRSLTSELQSALPENSPDYFVLDIPKDEVDAFTTAILDVVPGSDIRTAPMLRGRIVELNGVPVADAELPDKRTRLLLEGDRGLSYSAPIPENTRLIAGSWWAESYDGPPLVSFVADFAERFGLGIGDTVTVNVLGRKITAQVANLREVEWESLNINFSMIFPPSVLAAAPHSVLATVRFPKDSSLDAQAEAARAVGTALPAVTLVGVRDTIEAFNQVFSRIMTAIRAAGSLTLLAGALVLAGALATAQRRRIMQAVILKCIGATRRRLLLSHVLEYGILATIAAALSIVVGIVAAWIIATFVLEIEFVMSWMAAAVTLLLSVLLVLTVGSIGTWRILSARPVPYLRGL